MTKLAKTPWTTRCDESTNNWYVICDAEGVELGSCDGGFEEDEAKLMATAPELLEALRDVQELISAAATTGFNCFEGDWADRLFFSQQKTHRAITKATSVGGVDYQQPLQNN